MGAGRTELVMSLFGKSYGKRHSGQILLNGNEIVMNSVSDAIDNGIAYVTEDRKGYGLILIDDIRRNLSGGNQQKVVLGKWIMLEPEVLILDEPTRGIDVGAKYEIYQIINQLASEGKSIIMISSEMPELLGMCDRIYVVAGGEIAGELSGVKTKRVMFLVYTNMGLLYRRCFSIGGYRDCSGRHSRRPCNGCSEQRYVHNGRERRLAAGNQGNGPSGCRMF